MSRRPDQAPAPSVQGDGPVDTQLVELLARNRLIEDLVRAGLEVAVPLRDRGIDLIAYLDLAEAGGRFCACPIQLKAATATRFEVDTKYARVADLLLVFLWHFGTPGQVCYALTHAEALAVAESARWTATPTWIKTGKYSNTRVGSKLQGMLEPYRMDRDRWRQRILQVPGAFP